MEKDSACTAREGDTARDEDTQEGESMREKKGGAATRDSLRRPFDRSLSQNLDATGRYTRYTSN